MTEVAALVEQGWGLRVSAVRRLTGGLDRQAATYRVTAGGDYFVKVRTAPAPIAVPQWLHSRGIGAVVAPIGAPLVTDDGTQVLLYPFVEGRNCWSDGFTDEQYEEYGRILAAVHSAGAPPGVAVETFDPPSLRLLRDLPVAESGALTAIWRAHERHIALLIERVEGLLGRVSRADPVLCHGDLHTGNVLAGPAGLSIVDWDAPVLAPRERDLVFILAGPWGEQIATERRKALFYKGYGRREVHRPTLDYYHAERIVDDLGQFALTVLDPTADDEDKRTALYWLRRNLGQAQPDPA